MASVCLNRRVPQRLTNCADGLGFLIVASSSSTRDRISPFGERTARTEQTGDHPAADLVRGADVHLRPHVSHAILAAVKFVAACLRADADLQRISEGPDRSVGLPKPTTVIATNIMPPPSLLPTPVLPHRSRGRPPGLE